MGEGGRSSSRRMRPCQDSRGQRQGAPTRHSGASKARPRRLGRQRSRRRDRGGPRAGSAGGRQNRRGCSPTGGSTRMKAALAAGGRPEQRLGDTNRRRRRDARRARGATGRLGSARGRGARNSPGGPGKAMAGRRRGHKHRPSWSMDPCKGGGATRRRGADQSKGREGPVARRARRRGGKRRKQSAIFARCSVEGSWSGAQEGGGKRRGRREHQWEELVNTRRPSKESRRR